jgi:hypothetical protein
LQKAAVEKAVTQKAATLSVTVIPAEDAEQITRLCGCG